LAADWKSSVESLSNWKQVKKPEAFFETAFPVCARIMVRRRQHGTKIPRFFACREMRHGAGKVKSLFTRSGAKEKRSCLPHNPLIRLAETVDVEQTGAGECGETKN